MAYHFAYRPRLQATTSSSAEVSNQRRSGCTYPGKEFPYKKCSAPAVALEPIGSLEFQAATDSAPRPPFSAWAMIHPHLIPFNSQFSSLLLSIFIAIQMPTPILVSPEKRMIGRTCGSTGWMPQPPAQWLPTVCGFRLAAWD